MKKRKFSNIQLLIDNLNQELLKNLMLKIDKKLEVWQFEFKNYQVLVNNKQQMKLINNQITHKVKIQNQ